MFSFFPNQWSLPTLSSIFICFCKQQLWWAKINHVIYLANHSCSLQKHLEIKLQIERLHLYRIFYLRFWFVLPSAGVRNISHSICIFLFVYSFRLFSPAGARNMTVVGGLEYIIIKYIILRFWIVMFNIFPINLYRIVYGFRLFSPAGARNITVVGGGAVSLPCAALAEDKMAGGFQPADTGLLAIWRKDQQLLDTSNRYVIMSLKLPN